MLNVWEIEPRLLKQQIYLDDFDGKMPICIRFVHNPELVHAFVCTLGGAIYHLHRNSVGFYRDFDEIVRLLWGIIRF